jgi:Protein of unknown function (DUF1553)
MVGGAEFQPDVWSAIQRLRAIARTSPRDGTAATSPRALAEHLAEAHPDDWARVISWFREEDPAWRDIQRTLQKLESSGPAVKLTPVLVASEQLPHLPHNADDRGYPHFYPATYELRRGDVHEKGDVAHPGTLQVLTNRDASPDGWHDGATQLNSTISYRRTRLAQWITDTQRGAGSLAARVMVNRLWQHHFGRGIVSTPNDFGATGDPPTHPELLDWLATELIQGGWKLKRLHRLIMTSSTYMQSSDPTAIWDPGAASIENRMKIDPENRTLWRRTPQRLEGEAIRDSMLAAAGQLDDRLYGPGTLDDFARRRSIYFFIKRSQLIPTMMLFDWPEHLVSIGQRTSTTTAPQALMFLNNPLSRQAAEQIAANIQTPDTTAAIVAAYRTIFCRAPSSRELDLARQFVMRQVDAYRLTAGTDISKDKVESQAERDAIADLCQSLLGSNEFVYVD